MDLQVTLGCETPVPSSSLLTKDGDSDAGIAPSSPSPAGSQQPVKKQTRQWAAWTRQEEESFFNALRQVGKNFEKITCRVQSKNKDQVRHYYYRLVRRMNKLLGPGFSLDAKNSKDTNAAMLRWWSLLEKYSCKASKLHLKPRRFKIFIEALEHQLSKDRKKSIRKRSPQGENCSSSAPANVSLQSKASGNDTRSVKLVLVDTQNIQKVASGKGSSLKRNVNTGTNRSNNKADLSSIKTTRQRKKTGSSSAAYKRWEKAAIAGVSLVADAAEHLERTNISKELSPDKGISDELLSRPLENPTGAGIHSLGKVLPHLPVPSSSQHQVTETSVQPAKLKLQFFPIDETTRRSLEQDEHNPYLELTLSARKKITSVLEHLNRKWGNSSIASGELILFPYSVQRENLVDCQRWAQGTAASAADVYVAIGSPSVFRLRYGWFSNSELVSATSGASTSPRLDDDMNFNIWNRTHQISDAAAVPDCPTGHESEQLMESPKDRQTPMMENTDFMPSYTEFPEDMTGYIGASPEKNPLESSKNLATTSCFGNETNDESTRRHLEDADNLRTCSGAPLSAGDWADSLTNVSLGELLTEASRAMETDGTELALAESSQFLQQIPVSCDSFDAAIAAHIVRHGNQGQPSIQMSHTSSIWDGEETCDGFSFRNIPALNQDEPNSSTVASLETCEQIPSTSSMGFRGLVEELPGTQATDNPVCEGVEKNNLESDSNRSDDPVKDFGGLTDMYWPDSLGPLDLDMPSTRYHGQDLMFADSMGLSGLNRLIANSLDAFQNCSFFGLDKKEPSSSESREIAPLFDCTIGGEV